MFCFSVRKIEIQKLTASPVTALQHPPVNNFELKKDRFCCFQVLNRKNFCSFLEKKYNSSGSNGAGPKFQKVRRQQKELWRQEDQLEAPSRQQLGRRDETRWRTCGRRSKQDHCEQSVQGRRC
jgi:hypothetical protein